MTHSVSRGTPSAKRWSVCFLGGDADPCSAPTKVRCRPMEKSSARTTLACTSIEFSTRNANAVAASLSFHLISLDHSILDIDDAVGVFGDIVLVGDEDDGVAFGMQAV